MVHSIGETYFSADKSGGATPDKWVARFDLKGIPPMPAGLPGQTMLATD